LDIKSLSRARNAKRRYDAVISVEDPRAPRKSRLRFHNAPHPDHLVLRFEDIDMPDGSFAAARPEHVAAAIGFAREHVHDRLLVHCHVGVCRSTATGLAILADRLGAGRERDAVAALVSSNPDARPTLALLELADEALGRAGALVDAWMEIERSDSAYAEYRREKADFLAGNAHLFCATPPGGFFSRLRVLPDTLHPVSVDAAVMAFGSREREADRTRSP
jgi:predicted protein tyrosine phosphatase